METSTFSDKQFSDFLALVDAEVRPQGSATHAWEDFPLILGRENRELVLGLVVDDVVAAGVAYLVRQFQTSCGAIPVAGIGSVVTRSEFRGKGFSRFLQEELIKRLVCANVPLAVLWTDQPEIYAGRGFASAGWEFHVDITDLNSNLDIPAGFSSREFLATDVEAVAALYNRHPLCTMRLPDDASRLYNMPGTKGLVAVGEGDQVLAAVFCGKGADFPDYVPEWSGPLGLVVPLLAEVKRRSWARHVLVPPGGERLADQLVNQGASATAHAAGQWLVTQPEQLSRYLEGSGKGAPRYPADPARLLGTVGPDGVVLPGDLTVAVWGFDSV